MIKVRAGSTRLTFLVGEYAFKVPNPLFSWKNFLLGMLANDQEVQFYTIDEFRPLFIPLYFRLPYGILNVTAKALPLDRSELDLFRSRIEAKIAQAEKSGGKVPVEMKPDSFGWWRGDIRILDYGS